MGTNVTTAFITCPQNEKETLGIKLPFLVMIIKNVPLVPLSSRNILPSKCRCWMTKMFGDVLGLATTNPQHAWSLSSVQCLCVLMKGGIKFSSTYRTLRDVHTAATISRPYVWLFTRTAASAGYTFPIDCTARRNSHQSLNYSYPSKSSSEWSYHLKYCYTTSFNFFLLPIIASKLVQFFTIEQFLLFGLS